MTATPHDTDALARALKADLDGLALTATPPPASAVWFRAERRARLDALKRAEQPIWLAERMALVGAGAVLGWLSSIAVPWLETQDMAGRMASLVQSATAGIDGLAVAALGLMVACAVVASIGVLVATSGD